MRFHSIAHKLINSVELSEGPFHPYATLEHKEKAEFPEAKAEWIRILYNHLSHSIILASPPPWGHREFWLCCICGHVSETKHRSLLLSAVCDFVVSFIGWWRDKNSHSSLASNSLLHPNEKILGQEKTPLCLVAETSKSFLYCFCCILSSEHIKCHCLEGG